MVQSHKKTGIQFTGQILANLLINITRLKRKNVFSPINHCYKVAPYRIISLGEKRSRQKAEKTFALKWIERRQPHQQDAFKPEKLIPPQNNGGKCESARNREKAGNQFVRPYLRGRRRKRKKRSIVPAPTALVTFIRRGTIKAASSHYTGFSFFERVHHACRYSLT